MKYQTDPVKKNPLAPETVEGDTLGQTQAPPAFEVAADSLTPPPNDSLGTASAVEGADSLSTHPLDSLGNTGRDSLPPFDPAKKDTPKTPQPPKPVAKAQGKGLFGQEVGLGKANAPQDVYALMYRLEEIGFLTVDDWQSFGADKTGWEANGMQGPFPDCAIGKIIWRYQETIGVIAPDGYITPGLEKGTEAALIAGKGGKKKDPSPSTQTGIARPHGALSPTTNPLSPSVQTGIARPHGALSPATPDYDCIAREIFEAGQGWNTDEERIYTHLGMIEGGGTQAAELKKKFCELYDTDLETYLKKELWDVFGLGEESKALEVLNGGREKSGPEKGDAKEELEPKEGSEFIWGPVISPKDHFLSQAPPEIRTDGVKGISAEDALKNKDGTPNWWGSCNVTCKKILKNAGFKAKGATNDRIATITNGSRDVASTSKVALEVLDNNLANGMPVLVGVDKGYAGPNDYLTQGGEKTESDHFVVIIGKGKDKSGKIFYSYLDPGRIGAAGYDQEANRLYKDQGFSEGSLITEKGKFSDYAYSDKSGNKIFYTLAEVRGSEKIN
ncbi:MAG: hypothetical protein H6581_08000 [Bacteroidia bacterium]|nr:hypothetical protein [Bacteroidia bacterium]